MQISVVLLHYFISVYDLKRATSQRQPPHTNIVYLKSFNTRQTIDYPFTLMHLADTFIQSDLQCIQAIQFILPNMFPWESNPQPFALLIRCSTTELQEHHPLLNWHAFSVPVLKWHYYFFLIFLHNLWLKSGS